MCTSSLDSAILDFPLSVSLYNIPIRAVIAVVLSCRDIGDILATILRYHRCRNNLKTNES